MSTRPPQDVLDRIAGKSMLEIQGAVHRLIQDALQAWVRLHPAAERCP